jgi:hypothetical protein
MDKKRKKRILWFLEKALDDTRLASRSAGTVNDAESENVELCLHIGNAVEDLKAAMKELKNGI